MICTSVRVTDLSTHDGPSGDERAHEELVDDVPSGVDVDGRDHVVEDQVGRGRVDSARQGESSSLST